jgi:hypothetical protein
MMQRTIAPALKGLITAVLMIGVALWIHTKRDIANPQLQYIVYIIYGAGILWTLYASSRADAFTGKFKRLFSQGFKCFIVVTLLMVGFTGIFVKMNPQFAEQEAQAVREYYQTQKNPDKTQPEIEDAARQAKKLYPVIVISISIFRYLLIGAGLTVIFSVIITRIP